MSRYLNSSSGDWEPFKEPEKPKHTFQEVLEASKQSLEQVMRVTKTEDPRKKGLKDGFRQLTIEQLERVINYDGDMILDEFNYHEGKFCPLAVALELDKTVKYPTHDKVFEILTGLGYKVNNTREIPGEFYTTNRLKDLLEAAKEVLLEKEQLQVNANK